MVSNIAEGFGRKSNSQFIQFLEIASPSEVEAQLYVALDLECVTREQFDEALSAAQGMGRMPPRPTQYLRTTPNRPSSTSVGNH